MNNDQVISWLTALLCEKQETCEQVQSKQLIGEQVIVRCRDAGVHYGTLFSYEGREVVLNDSRRMWYWKAAKGHTLSGCAINGIHSDSKITAIVKTIILPEACEIMLCNHTAIGSINDAPEYNP